MQRIETPEVGGVRIHRHRLDCEAIRLTRLARRVGQRLDRWLKQHPDEVPDKDDIEIWKWYQRTIAGLLAEQRARAVLVRGAAPMTDDEYAAEVKALTEDMVLSLSDEQLKQLIAKRDAVEVMP